jgi:phosphomannomutase
MLETLMLASLLLVLLLLLLPSFAATANNVQLVLANDPDADRLAAAEQSMQDGKGTGQFTTFSGNDIGLLLADWVWTNFKKQHPEVCWVLGCLGLSVHSVL